MPPLVEPSAPTAHYARALSLQKCRNIKRPKEVRGNTIGFILHTREKNITDGNIDDTNVALFINGRMEYSYIYNQRLMAVLASPTGE